MKNANFIAIDFETATFKRMPCQLGLAVVKEGLICEKQEWYIQPPENRYDDRLIEIHGITPEITQDALTFPDVWNKVRDYFEANFIVGHNLSFDLDVLYRALSFYDIPEPHFTGTACTCSMLNRMSLSDACTQYHICLDNHHSALCDAVASASLYLKYLDGVFDSEPPIHQTPNHRTANHHRNAYFEINLSGLADVDELNFVTPSVFEQITESDCCAKKGFIITGKTNFERDFAYDIIRKLGGKRTGISGHLNIAIIGNEPGPKKIEQIQSLNDKGQNIALWNESEFVTFVKQMLHDQKLVE